MKEVFSREQLSSIFNQDIRYGICDICVNSKNAKDGDLFIALEGENTDGHNFIKDALSNGAVLAVSQRDIEPANRIVMVESSYEALLKLAKYNLSRTNAQYIGVTGSVGKTTTRDMIYHLLVNSQESSNAYVSRKNFNGQIGLPICATLMPPETKVGVFEMGMSESGEIRKLIDIVSPDISVITNVCETHLEYFDSVFDIAKAKSEIFETAKPQKAAIIPNDLPYTDFLVRKAHQYDAEDVFTFGAENKSDARMLSYDFIYDIIRVKAEIFGQDITYDLRCNNISCVMNSLAALLTVHVKSGYSSNVLAESMETFMAPAGRGEAFYINSHDVIIVDDSYNACPTSMRSAIISLSKYKNRRKIVVIGDMLELGPDSVRFHENIAPTIDKFDVDKVFACGKLSKCLFDNILEEKKGCWCENSTELAEKVVENIADGDCVLIKGSNSMKMKYIVDFIKKHFNKIAA
ncbi:UDP-N-acetylmuramoyl-tripeptide--D-alanyl-D-alanine ligase [Alphaproteobacteria bacterium]|nr:UDP-N-acetylmuramoyl-tripeptide--D-alanyl-D-alanine ligase [Alphaproteobacteria bacterium]